MRKGFDTVGQDKSAELAVSVVDMGSLFRIVQCRGWCFLALNSYCRGCRLVWFADTVEHRCH